MNRFLLTIILFIASIHFGVSQNTYYAQATGAWNSSSNWNTERDGSGVSGIPGANDIAYLEGFSIFITTNVIVGNVLFEYDVPNQIRGTSLVRTLTINGKISGYELTELFPGFFDEAPREVVAPVFESMPNVTVIFTGQDGENPVISSWSHDAPIRNLRFILSNPDFEVQIEDVAILGLSNIIESGNVRISQGFSLADNGTNARLTVNTGANLIVDGAINGNGTNFSKIGDIVINGNVTTGSSGYINSVGFTLGATGNLTVNFIGTDQQSGWWFGSGVNAPNAPILNTESNINFRANSDQNIPAVSYGNLRLDAPFVAASKNLQTGSLNVQGNLVLESSNVTFNTSAATSAIQIGGNVVNNGTWNPTQLVRMNGSIAQSITGDNPITFLGGVRFENTAAAVSLSNQNINVESEFDIDPSATFNPDDRNVTLNGNLVNDGTLIAGTTNSTFSINDNTEISGAGSTNFRNLTISETGNLIAPFEGNFTVRSNFSNNGVFDANSGAVNFSGTSPKNIQGSSLSTFNDLNIINNAVVRVQGTAELANLLTLETGTNFDADGSGSGVFTLLSTQTRDAAIAAIPEDATFTGDLTIQRAIYTLSETNRGYHIMSFPTNGISISELQQNISITGNFTGSSPCPTANCGTSLFAYNESLGGDLLQNQRFVPYPTTSNAQTLNAGQGYFLYTYENEAPVTLSGKGSLFRGDYERAITYTGTNELEAGWNLVGNPYPAPTDWTQWINTGIEGGTAHIYDPSNGSYFVYDGTGTDPQLIAKGQGFFVKSMLGGGEVTATEATKVTGSTPVFYRNQSPLERFEIVLVKDTIEDVSIISFVEGATDAYEPEFDATRLLNTFETLSTLSADGRPLKVNRLSRSQNNDVCERSIFLNLEKMKKKIDYQLQFRDLENVPNFQYTLIDHYLNDTVMVQENTSISFRVTDDAISKGSGRFELILENNPPAQLSLEGAAVCPEESAVLQIENTQSDLTYRIYKGDTLVSSFIGTGDGLGITIENSFLTTGENEFELFAKNGACDSVNVGRELITKLEPLNFDNQVTGSMVCEHETFAPFEIQTQNEANYFILQNADTLLSFEGNGALYTGRIATTNLSDGVNTLIIGVEKDGCQTGILEHNLEITLDALIIDETISYFGNSTCDISKGKIVIDTQDNITYDIVKGEQLVSSVVGTGEEIQTEINQNFLAEGVNEFSIIAKYGTCSIYELEETARITIDLLEAPEIVNNGNILESSIADADSYLWYFNGEIIPNETNKFLLVTVAGEYYLEISKGDCRELSNFLNITETILSSNDALTNAVNIYPNPVSEILGISIEDVNEVKVTIFTLSGQFVNRYLLKGAENTIDVSKLDKGTYLIQLDTDKGSVTKRIVKN